MKAWMISDHDAYQLMEIEGQETEGENPASPAPRGKRFTISRSVRAYHNGWVLSEDQYQTNMEIAKVMLKCKSMTEAVKKINKGFERIDDGLAEGPEDYLAIFKDAFKELRDRLEAIERVVRLNETKNQE